MNRVKSKLELIDERSEALNEVIGKMPPFLYKWGLMFLLGFVSMILVFSWLIKYPDQLDAPITITAASPPIALIAESGGRVNLLVADHEKVKKDAILGMVQNAADLDDILYVKNELIRIQKMLSNGQNLRYCNLKGNLKIGEIQPAYEEFQKDLTDFQTFIKIEPIKNNITTSIKKLKNAYAQKNKQQQINAIMVSDLQLKQRDLERYKKLWEGKVISQKEYDDAKRSFLQASKTQEDENLTEITTDATIEQIKGDMRNLEAEQMQRTQSYHDLLLEDTRKNLAAIAQWEHNYVFRSFIDGTVSLNNVWKNNQYIEKGNVAMTITPDDNAHFVGKAFLAIDNSGKVKIGQRVNIKLSSHPFYEYGMLIGKVQSISAVPNKDNKYLINVQIPKKLITTYHKEIKFSSSLQGTATIIVDDTRLLQRIFNKFIDQTAR